MTADPAFAAWLMQRLTQPAPVGLASPLRVSRSAERHAGHMILLAHRRAQ